MQVKCTINGVDYSSRLSTYSVDIAPETQIITALSGKEYPFTKTLRSSLNLSFFPMTDSEAQSLYSSLSQMVVDVLYTHPYLGEVSEKMRLNTSLSAIFALVSVDGKRRYKGGQIQLRAIE